MSLLVTLLLVAADPSQGTAQPPAPPAEANAQSGLICKIEPIATGSIMAKRVCKTAQDWIDDSGEGNAEADYRTNGAPAG